MIENEVSSADVLQFEHLGSLLFVGHADAFRHRSGGTPLRGTTEIEGALRRYVRLTDHAHRIRQFLARLGNRDLQGLKEARLLRTLATEIVARGLVCAVFDTAGEPVTAETVRLAMQGAPLKSQQSRVSLPTIQKYVNMLKSGSEPPPIKVDGGIIVEGNHRYVAGRICGKDPPMQEWPGGRSERVVPWERIEIDPAEW